MRNKLTRELAVCGFNAVKALGELHPETITRLFLGEDRLRDFSQVCKLLAEARRPYKICEDDELERICQSNRHQGVVAMIEEPEVAPASPADIDDWAREGRTGLVLHSVGNDHNLGAMVRSAAFFDAYYVIIAEGDREAVLSTSAYRVAGGGMEHLNFRRVRNTAAFLQSLSRQVISLGAELRARRRIQDLPMIIREQTAALKTRPEAGQRPGIAIVLGNEERGLPPEVQESCSALVRIPGIGAIESLNVAQAATLFLQAAFEFSL
ncbi:MAG: RNA methyltransferase [Treponema sp.]|jgi:TrmH RNA methyltransferase|nr:RNA methyltransferase [Treponema sp.]